MSFCNSDSIDITEEFEESENESGSLSRFCLSTRAPWPRPSGILDPDSDTKSERLLKLLIEDDRSGGISGTVMVKSQVSLRPLSKLEVKDVMAQQLASGWLFPQLKCVAN